jgi:hypothetical protein
MNQCVGAVENMFHVKFPPPNVSNLSKRKSLGDLVDHPTKRQAITAPFEPPLAPIRALQPRPPLAPPHAPPNANGYPLPVNPISTTQGGPTTGKKRGRPSKADKEAQAQARAAYSRPTEYTRITPAPPAVQPKREYASSPGYELASNGPDPASKKRPTAAATDSPRQSGSSFPMTSPASTTGTPRALPEPLEQLERTNMSPRDRNSAPVDSRSPPLIPLSQHTSEQSQAHAQILPRPQTHPVPIQPTVRPPQSYEPYKGPDPIFPDRDRSRTISNQMPKNATPPSPVINRT